MIFNLLKTQNKWGAFEVVANKQDLVLSTTYTSPNSQNEAGYTLTLGNLDQSIDINSSYDGLGVDIHRPDGTTDARIYLEIGVNQLEALRVYLEKWHKERVSKEIAANKPKEYDKYAIGSKWKSKHGGIEVITITVKNSDETFDGIAEINTKHITHSHEVKRITQKFLNEFFKPTI